MRAARGSSPLRLPASLAELLRRPEIDYASLEPLDEGRPHLTRAEQDAVAIALKYEGYIRLEEERIRQFRKLERKRLPPDLDYQAIRGLRLEARQKLAKLRPVSIGQAGRISGVSPADLSVLLVYLRALSQRNEEPQHESR